MTAKQLFDKLVEEGEVTTYTEMMIEFAKYHVTEALKQASEQADVDYELSNPYDANSSYSVVDKNSILNAYPLSNVK